MNAAAKSIQNASQNTANSTNAMSSVNNAGSMSPELARVDQETKLAQTEMAMSMVKKLIITSIIMGVLAMGGAIAFGVFSMNKVDNMRTERLQHNERMMNNAIDRIQYGL